MPNPAPAPAEPRAYPVSAMLRRATLAISALIGASALVGAGLALLTPVIAPGQHPSWPFLAFEGVIILAATIGVLFGLGRYADAPGIALACVAGTILIA